MRITLRLLLALVLAAAAVVFISTGFQARQEQVRREEELERRASVLAESLQESAEPLVASENLEGLRRLVQRFGDRERLAGIVVYASDGQPFAITASLPARFQELPEIAREGIQADQRRDAFLIEGQQRWHLEILPLHRAGEV